MPVSLRERVLPIDIRTDHSLPAFTHCSLDDDPGNGDPKDGAPKGQVNLYLAWETTDIVDAASRWEATVYLTAKAPKDSCTVQITPRRLQRLKTRPGQKLPWRNTDLATGKVAQKGTVTADRWGLLTLENVIVAKGRNRIRVGE